MNDLDAVIRKVAQRLASQHRRFDEDELFSEGWVWAHSPERAKMIANHVGNTHNSDPEKYESNMGEARLFNLIHEHLNKWIDEQNGKLPRAARPEPELRTGQYRTAEMSNDELYRLFGEDWGGQGNHGYSILEVDPEPVEYAPLNGKYGFAQDPWKPFGILEHMLDVGAITPTQADYLKLMMDGDGPSDLASRYPEEMKGAVQTAVSRALTAMRKEPKVQEWGRELGYDPLATKGKRFESEHRHCDGRPAGPAAQRPFLCDCERGQASYDEDALDRSDPFLRVLPSDTERVQPTRAA